MDHNNLLEAEQHVHGEDVRQDCLDASAHGAEEYCLPRPGGEEVGRLTARVGACHWRTRVSNRGAVVLDK